MGGASPAPTRKYNWSHTDLMCMSEDGGKLYDGVNACINRASCQKCATSAALKEDFPEDTAPYCISKESSCEPKDPSSAGRVTAGLVALGVTMFAIVFN